MAKKPFFSVFDGATPQSRAAVVRSLLIAMTLLLLCVTWRLWIPQQVYPQVPLIHAAGSLPHFAIWLALVGVVVGLLLGLLGNCKWLGNISDIAMRLGLLLFAGCMCLLFVLDQHRLQPWAYQAVLMAIALACVETRRALTFLRLLTLSIYFFSSLSKLDYTFLHSVGQQFTETLLGFVGVSHWTWSEPARVLTALIFPLGELFVVGLLTLPRTRQVGICFALAMHGLLLLVFGPWGMDQQWGVLVWNVQFMLLLWPLFGRGKSRPMMAENETEITPEPPLGSTESLTIPSPILSWLSRPAQGVLLLAILLPLLEPLGLWDHWLSWGLYSPGASRVQVYVRASDVESFPPSWPKYLEQNAGDPNWNQVRMDLWSLHELGVPVYPQARFQLGVAAAVVDVLPGNHDAYIVEFSAANRFTGERTQQTLTTRPQLEAALNQYWLNADATKID